MSTDRTPGTDAAAAPADGAGVDDLEAARALARALWRELDPPTRDSWRQRGHAPAWVEDEDLLDDDTTWQDPATQSCSCERPDRAPQFHSPACPVFLAWSHRGQDHTAWKVLRLAHLTRRTLAVLPATDVPRELVSTLLAYRTLSIELLAERDDAFAALMVEPG